MEVGFGVSIMKINIDNFEPVLILILVEVGFGAHKMAGPPFRIISLNPYSSGGGVRC